MDPEIDFTSITNDHIVLLFQIHNKEFCDSIPSRIKKHSVRWMNLDQSRKSDTMKAFTFLAACFVLARSSSKRDFGSGDKISVISQRLKEDFLFLTQVVMFMNKYMIKESDVEAEVLRLKSIGQRNQEEYLKRNRKPVSLSSITEEVEGQEVLFIVVESDV